MPCITSRHSDAEIRPMLDEIMGKCARDNGIYIQRCITDLRLALSNTEDTAFYCFRGIESLKQYCKYKYGIKSEKEQWKKLIEITELPEMYMDDIKKIAFPQRHGDIVTYSSDDRAKMLNKTWDIVEKFIHNV